MVRSYVQLLAKHYQGKLDAAADEFIGYTVEGVCRMEQLVRGLRDYCQVGTQAPTVAALDCKALLEQTLANLQMAVAESGAAVTHDPLPVVRADRAQLGQVLQHLIGNALKFHGPEPAHVHITARREGRQWVFAVRDNGIGLDPRQAARIFKLFRRLHTREQYPGTGMGLAICQKIVERHGGRTWVESAPGQGATFFFTLPAP
jgi:light-regulated signal transduction histidine kinase (bacteriophytochrome)